MLQSFLNFRWYNIVITSCYIIIRFSYQSVNRSLHELYRENIETTSSHCANIANNKLIAILQ